jgi:hypothetical protein
MITREKLAAMTDEELHEFMAGCGAAGGDELSALLDCEFLRRPQFMTTGCVRMIVRDWEDGGIPPSVPELRTLLAAARKVLGIPDGAHIRPAKLYEHDEWYELDSFEGQAMMNEIAADEELVRSGGPWPGLTI